MAFPRAAYADRTDAGRRLLDPVRELLSTAPPGEVVLLGLPRGGVVVAAQLTPGLGAELDALIVAKVFHPRRPELALGAVSATAQVGNDAVIRRLGVGPEDLHGWTERALQEVRRREQLYRGGRPPPAVTGRVVLVVDDGIATGASARVALAAVRAQHPAWLGFAAPVGPPDVAAILGPPPPGAADVEAGANAVAGTWPGPDGIAVPWQPAGFGAVSRYYRHFGQTSDEEVLAALNR